MLPMIKKAAPSITKMIRMDHSHVLLTFHRYHADTPPARKKGLAETICLALEVHAQLEEEILYPVLRAAMPVNEFVGKSEPEHDEMRRLIAQLRALAPTDDAYDTTFMALMREVIHHVADEETVLLPVAEALPAAQLAEMSARMLKRRLELVAPRAGAIAKNTAQGMPVATLLASVTALLLGGLLVRGAFARSA